LKGEEFFPSEPFAEFMSDVAICFGIGLIAAVFTVTEHGVPWQSGVKLVIGTLTIGLVIGMLNFLEMEYEVMGYLRKIQHEGSDRPRLTLTVSRKVTFLMVSVMTVSAMVIGFMIINDVKYLTAHREILTEEHFYAIFYEVAFVTLVMMVFSFMIIRRFSRNMNTLFELQLSSMEQVENGVYDTRVPIVSTDEFSVMAVQTNKMISGLKERDFIHDSFGRYVTKEIRDLILSRSIPLDGEQRTATILFCDIRGYTTYVESRDPKHVVQRINEYFTEMSTAIENHSGLVLQFIGDEIEAVFGAPLSIENHPEQAIAAALEMRKRLTDLNATWEAQGDDPFRHGIGIHTGEVLAGNIGSPDRHSYLMVGDAVNLASRIQTLTKEYHCDILLSGETGKQITNGLDLEHMGKVRVRGREEEIDVYKVP
jgi:class 3 adenylate cyclase